MLFAQRGVAPQHRFGQNFLIDLNIHDLIVEAAGLGPDDVVLEIGPGAGAMTALMATKASEVIAVDIDPAMVGLTEEATAGMSNVRVILADALASKHSIEPAVLDHVRDALAISPERRFKLVANLPYNVATPLILNLLVHPELCPSKIVVTIQLELADRMRAAPGTEAYGALSVLIQALSDCELVRALPPTVFWPRPKVESAVVAITPNPVKRGQIRDLPWFQSAVRQIFLHRRKNLRGALHSAFGESITKPEIDATIESIGLNSQIRAEAMNVEEFLALVEALRERLGPATPEIAPDI